MPVDELPGVKYVPVKGFLSYRVGDDGSVWSRAKNTRLSDVVDGWHVVIGSKDRDGYRRVILCEGGKRKYVRVNVLVLSEFNGPPPLDMKHPTAAHENGVREDNRLSNLSWKSQKSNVADKIRHGTHQCGTKNGNSILNEEKVMAIRERRKSGAKLRVISEEFGVSIPTVQAVASGRLWKNLPV